MTSATNSSPVYPHRFPHRGILPEGRYYTLTWGIPCSFGGMTAVVLDRSSKMAQLDNRAVDILTLAPDMKTQDREKELRDEGRIDRRVRVRNIWKDLTSWPQRKLRTLVGTVEASDDPIDDRLPRASSEWSESRLDAEGRTIQCDRYHDNGRLLVIDRRDANERGKVGGRRITLFGRSGEPIAQWRTAREFYQAWMDSVLGSKQTYLIVDSAFVGNFMHSYRRENVVLCQVLHSHFLQDSRGEAFSELAEGKFSIVRHLDAYDVVTTLTDQQRADMSALELSYCNLRAVSNLTDELEGNPFGHRDTHRGGMVARLVELKRIDPLRVRLERDHGDRANQSD
ncbi:MAG: hypothetical protein ACTH2U_01595, partial [Brevibacterium sp.]